MPINIGIIAHIDAGKTTTSEQILFLCNKIYKVGSVDGGTTALDWMEEEQNRGITITSAAMTIAWKGQEINLIDTPGHVDFTMEVERSLRVLDGSVGIFCAVGGVEPQSETVWQQANRYQVRRLAYVNKMDRIGADFERTVADIRTKFDITPVCISVPIGKEKEFEGIIDILSMKELHFERADYGKTVIHKEIRATLRDTARYYRTQLLDVASEYSDTVAELIMDDKVPSQAQLIAGIRKGVLSDRILPIYCGSSLQSIGVHTLLDGITAFLPYPQELPPATVIDRTTQEVIPQDKRDSKVGIGLAFKSHIDTQMGLLHFIRIYHGTFKSNTIIYESNLKIKERILKLYRVSANKFEEISELNAGDIGVMVGPKHVKTGQTFCTHNVGYVLEGLDNPIPVISSTLEVNSLDQRKKLLSVLGGLHIEDPSFSYKEDEDTGQIIISGMGELHIEVIVHKLYQDYNISLRQGKPQVHYKEMPKETIRGQECIAEPHRKAGDKQAEFMFDIEIIPLHSQNTTHPLSVECDALIPLEVQEEIKSGILQDANTGIRFGYPIINTRVVIHTFEIRGKSEKKNLFLSMAASQAFHRIMRSTDSIKLEPIMKLNIVTPIETVGDAVKTINARGGIIHNTTNKSNTMDQINAEAQLKALFGFSTALRSTTKGRGTFSMEFSHFAPVDIE